VDGDAVVDGRRAFVLKLIQGRKPEWVNRVFFARYDPDAAWFDELRPLHEAEGFFFERSTGPDRSETVHRPAAIAGRRRRRAACHETEFEHRERRVDHGRTSGFSQSEIDARLV
jgi:hypothetical protein